MTTEDDEKKLIEPFYDDSQKIAVVLGGPSYFDLEIVRRLANNFKGIIYFASTLFLMIFFID